MAADGSADFTLRLHNQVTGPARQAERSIRGLSSTLRDQQRVFSQGENAFQKQLKARRRMSDNVHREELARRRRFSVDSQRAIIRQNAAARKVREQARLAEGEGGFKGGFGDVGFVPSAAGAMTTAIGLTTAALVAAGAAAAFLAAKFAAATFEAINFGQRSVIALTSILKDGAAAAQQFFQVRMEAATLGLEVFKTVDSFRALANAQFDTGTARELVRMSADLQAVTGSAESAEFALRAITQIKMKGRLQAEEVTGQLAEHGVSADEVYRVLGKRLGKTRQEILKMQKAGELTADVAIPAILQAVRNQLGVEKSGDFAKQIAAGTLGGLASQFSARITNAFITLGQKLEPAATKLAQTVFGFLNRMADSPAAQTFAGTLVESFNAFQVWVTENWPKIEATLVGGFNAIVGFARDTAEFFRNNWDTIRRAILGVAVVASLVVPPLLDMGRTALIVAKPFVALAEFIGFLTEKILNLQRTLGELFVSTGAAIAQIPGLGKTGQSLMTFGDDVIRRSEFSVTAAKEESAARAAQNARSQGFAANAGALAGGTRIGDVKFGDINVNLNGSDATPGNVAGNIRDQTRREMLSMLQDF